MKTWFILNVCIYCFHFPFQLASQIARAATIFRINEVAKMFSTFSYVITLIVIIIIIIMLLM